PDKFSDTEDRRNRGLDRFGRELTKIDLPIGPTADWRPPLLLRAKYQSNPNRAPNFEYRCRTRAVIRSDRRKIPAATAMALATNKDRQSRRGRRTVPGW